MKYRKLRIAWSVCWGVVCVLLFCLWVRSFWWVELYVGQVSSQRFIGIGILPGAFGGTIDSAPNSFSMPTDEWLKNTERTLSRIAANKERILKKYPHANRAPPLPSRFWGIFFIGLGGVWVPFWFLGILTATLAALPWLRFQFSVRTLLLATTAVAVVFGLIVYTVRG